MRTDRAPSADADEVVVFDSRLGWIAILADERAILRMTAGHDSRRAALAALDAPTAPLVDELTCAPELVGQLAAYAAGEPVNFARVRLEMAHLTQFGRRVTDQCRRIPFGQAISYAQLAVRAGAAGAARAVGSVMRRNRWPLIVPCHRVVNADGSVGNYSGPQGVRMKRRLLALEEQALPAGSPGPVSRGQGAAARNGLSGF